MFDYALLYEMKLVLNALLCWLVCWGWYVVEGQESRGFGLLVYNRPKPLEKNTVVG